MKENEKPNFLQTLFSPKDKTIKLIPDVQNEEMKKRHNFNFHIKEGDVFGVGENLFVNNNGKLQRLKMTPNKFRELFPFNKSNQSQQGRYLDDCWLVAVLNGLMRKPAGGKAAIYNTLRQESDNMYVKIGNSEIYFPDSKVPLSENKLNLTGAKGLQMIEEAFAAKRTMSIETNFKRMTDVFGIDRVMKNLNNGFEEEALNLIIKNKKIKSLGFNKSYAQESAIKKYANRDDVFIGIGTYPNYTQPGQRFGGIIKPTHAHTITGYDKKTDIVSIQDSHHPDDLIKITLKELMKYPFSLTYCKLK